MAQPLRVKYTPAQIALMTDKTVRQRYSKLRKAAMQRAKRIQAAGFGDTDVADVRFPTVRELTPEQMREELAEASRYLRDPRTTVKGLRQYAKKMSESLQQAGYDIPERSLPDFGRFMDAMRARHKGRMMPSDIMASIYDSAARVGVSGKTLERNFKKFLDNEQKAQNLLNVLQTTELPAGRKRLSSKELMKLL